MKIVFREKLGHGFLFDIDPNDQPGKLLEYHKLIIFFQHLIFHTKSLLIELEKLCDRVHSRCLVQVFYDKR